MSFRDITLVGGSSTRLRLARPAVGKQALPVRDKPMLYCPLSTPVLAGIHEIRVLGAPLRGIRYPSDGVSIGHSAKDALALELESATALA